MVARRIQSALAARGRVELTALVDALYPRRCTLCARAAADGVACDEHALPWPLDRPCPPGGERCGRCATELPAGIGDGQTCAACRRDPPVFREVRALWDYRREARLQPWIGALKYGGRRDVAALLGTALAGRLALAGSMKVADSGPVVLVPIPLHPWRRLERGYDQALLLARAAARCAATDLARALVRTRATPPQGAPGARSRRANVRGAFALRRRGADAVRGASAWLVDDVVTSGATAGECGRLLRQAGARRVGVLCVARAGLGTAPPDVPEPDVPEPDVPEPDR